MLSLIATLLFGILFAFFATQNTSLASIKIGYFSLPNIPMYLIILGSMLLGIVVASIISGINSLSTFISLKKREKSLYEREKDIEALNEKVYLLEMENANLKGNPLEKEHKRFELEPEKRNFFDRLRHNLSS